MSYSHGVTIYRLAKYCAIQHEYRIVKYYWVAASDWVGAPRVWRAGALCCRVWLECRGGVDKAHE